jgi:hypothetical protein
LHEEAKEYHVTKLSRFVPSHGNTQQQKAGQDGFEGQYSHRFKPQKQRRREYDKQ